MAIMTDLEKTLLTTILKGKWALTGKLAIAKIIWTRSFWRAESGGTFEDPRIEVSHINVPRHQEVGQLFHFFARVRVYKWSTGSSDARITTAKDLKWQMMEEIQRIIALYDPNTGSQALPTNWKDILIMSCRSIDVEELKRPLLGEEFVIRIKFHWSP